MASSSAVCGRVYYLSVIAATRAKMLAALNNPVTAALVAMMLKNFSVHLEALKHEKFAFVKVVELTQQKSMLWIRGTVAAFEQMQSLACERFTHRRRRNVMFFKIKLQQCDK